MAPYLFTLLESLPASPCLKLCSLGLFNRFFIEPMNLSMSILVAVLLLESSVVHLSFLGSMFSLFRGQLCSSRSCRLPNLPLKPFILVCYTFLKLTQSVFLRFQLHTTLGSLPSRWPNHPVIRERNFIRHLRSYSLNTHSIVLDFTSVSRNLRVIKKHRRATMRLIIQLTQSL